MLAEAAHGVCGLVHEARDGSLAPGDAQTLAPASDIGGVGRAMGAPARRRMIMPGPARGHIDLERDFSAQALTGGGTPCWGCFCHLRFPCPSSLRGAKRRSNPYSVIPGWRVSTRPGISRFRVRCFASPRNDESMLRGACHRAALRADPLAHPARYPIYASNPLRLVTSRMKQ